MRGKEVHGFNWAVLIHVRITEKPNQLQIKAMKPAVWSQTTDEADDLSHHREIGNFKAFKLEKEEKNNQEESLGQKIKKLFRLQPVLFGSKKST